MLLSCDRAITWSRVVPDWVVWWFPENQVRTRTYRLDFLVACSIGFSAHVLIAEPRAEQRASCGHLFVAGFGWLSLPDGSAWRGRPQLVD